MGGREEKGGGTEPITRADERGVISVITQASGEQIIRVAPATCLCSTPT